MLIYSMNLDKVWNQHNYDYEMVCVLGDNAATEVMTEAIFYSILFFREGLVEHFCSLMQ